MMTDDTRLSLLKDILMLVLGGAIGFISQHWKRPQVVKDEHEDYQNKTIETQGRTLSDAWKMIESLQETIERQDKRIQEQADEITNLKDELRKYINAYARAVRFIHEKVPDVEIPDFTQTNPKIGKKK